MLNVGWMTAAVGIWRQGEPEPESPVRLPVPAYLIETESERILVDTGLHPAAVADSEAHYGPGPIAFFALEQERSIAEQVDLSTLTRVVLTHLHFDHAGALELIPDSVPVVVQRAEWEGGRDKGAIDFYETRPREVILYFRALAPHAEKAVPLELLATVPGRFTSPASRAYLYYTNEHKHWVAPSTVTITP